MTLATAQMEQTEVQETDVARPLRVLVPLIKDELDAGDAAGVEHFRLAGEMLLEAKSQLRHGEFTEWVRRNFHRSIRQCQEYMRLAALSDQKRGGPRFSTLRDAARPNWAEEPARKKAQEEERNAQGDGHYREFRSNGSSGEFAKEQQQGRLHEQQLLHKLSCQLIDLGFKALSVKLHPDRGGNTEAMQRLNAARSLLKRLLKRDVPFNV